MMLFIYIVCKKHSKIWYNLIVGRDYEYGAKCHNFGQKKK